MTENGSTRLTMSEAAEVIGVKVYRVMYWCQHPTRYPHAVSYENAYGYREMELGEAHRIKAAIKRKPPRLGRPKEKRA